VAWGTGTLGCSGAPGGAEGGPEEPGSTGGAAKGASAVPAAASQKDPEQQLSKKERKQKEMEELEAVLAELGINASSSAPGMPLALSPSSHPLSPLSVLSSALHLPFPMTSLGRSRMAQSHHISAQATSHGSRGAWEGT